MSLSIITFANLGEKTNHRTAGIVPVINKFSEEGELKQVVCQINKNSQFPGTVSATPTLLRYIVRVFEKVFGISLRRVHQTLLDFFASIKLTDADVHLFHAGESFTRTLRKSKKSRAISVGIATISDLQKNKDIENKEMRLLGIEDYITDAESALRRCPEYRSFDYIIAYSDFVKASYIAKGFPRDKIYVAYSDIPLPPTPSFQKSEDTFKVLYVAYTSPRKGLHYLLEAWNKLTLPNLELIVVGGYGRMPDELKERCKKIIKNNPSIRWAGKSKNPSSYYQEASVFAFPSLFEGNPKVVMEAMSYGVPVITTNHAQSIVEDGKSGFVVPIRDVEAFAEKIRFYYENRNVAECMGREGRKAMENKKSFGDMVFEIYQKILAREGKNND
ncbi:MAG: glycosyltransferase family 4 protein [Candidatus Paceibacterota bacterium]